MEKRKLLFCIRDFNHGGIPKSLESLLALLDKDKYEITIFCAFQQGYYKSVFSQYNVLPYNKMLYWFCVNYRTLHGFAFLFALMFKTLCKLLLKLKIDLFDLCLRNVAKRISRSKGYNTAIAYAEGWITNFVSYMSDVERKVAWIHMDYKRVLVYDGGEADNAAVYSKFDCIVSPCKYSVESFKDVHPELSDKLIAVKNVLDVDAIKKASQEPIDDKRFSTDDFTIVSVGRICHEKQFYEIPCIVDEIRQKKRNLKWYIIGSGPDAEVNILKENIKKYHVEDNVILLGAKDNPYPYIAKSNLVALLSLSETFSYVAYEAKILEVPLIITNFGAAEEIVGDVGGIVASKVEFATKIIELLDDTSFYDELKASLLNYSYNNDFVMSQLDKIF